MRTWTADVELDLAKCHEIVVAQFPEFENLKAEVMGQGWDNLCVLYEDGVVFRFPTRAVGGKLILRELAALPFLKGKVPLSIPEFEFVGQPRQDYPYDFVGYRALPGVTSDRLDWTSSFRGKAVAPLANFLKALHSLPITQELQERLPTTLHSETNLEWLMDRISVRRDEALACPLNSNEWINELSSLAEDLRKRAKGEPGHVICHGDLYPRHVLADDSFNIIGIIDWGDVHLGHPGADLSLAYTFFDAAEREEFWRIYERPVSEEGLIFAQLKAILYAFALFGYGSEVNDKPIRALGLRIGESLLRA